MDYRSKNYSKFLKITMNFFVNYCRGILQIRYVPNFNETCILEAFITSHYKCFDSKVFNFDLELTIIKLGEH